MTPVAFRGDLWRQKTRIPELSSGFGCMILSLALLVEHLLVSDGHRQTRTQALGKYRACIISRVNDVYAATAHAPNHPMTRGSKTTTFLESPTPICLFSLQLLLGSDDD